MKADNFVFQKYLNRIGFIGETKADLSTITELMRCQLFTIPFENLDVQAGKIVSLVPEDIVEKIIDRNRGGYCFEVNGIFAMALNALGVSYQFVAARPMFYPERRPKTHMAIVFRMNDEEWLCDLGFGNYGIRAPIPLNLIDTEIKQDFDVFRLSKANEHEFLLKAKVEEEWVSQYAFDLYPQEWIDFLPANYFSSSHPATIFVQKLVIVLHNPNGRDMYVGNVLKTMYQGRIEKKIIPPQDRESVLRDIFGLAETGLKSTA